MARLTASERSPILNELILTVRKRPSRPRRFSVAVDNCPQRDRLFMTAIARLVAVWLSRTWEE